MADYLWNTAQSVKSGDALKPRYTPGSIGLDGQSTPGFYTNAIGQRTDVNGTLAPFGSTFGPNGALTTPTQAWGTVSPTGTTPATAPAAASGIGTAGGASGGGAWGNPYSTISNVKSQPLSDSITKALGDVGANRDWMTKQGDLFSTESAASRATTRGFLNQENANVGGYFDGTVQGQLDAIRAKANAADALAVTQAYGGALRASKAARLGGGNDTYTSRLITGALGPIYAQQAKDAADREAAMYQWNSSAQRGLLGQRSGAETAYLNTATAPAAFRNMLTQAQLDQLNTVGLMDSRNTFYGLQKPGQDAIFPQYQQPNYGQQPQALAKSQPSQPLPNNARAGSPGYNMNGQKIGNGVWDPVSQSYVTNAFAGNQPGTWDSSGQYVSNPNYVTGGYQPGYNGYVTGDNGSWTGGGFGQGPDVSVPVDPGWNTGGAWDQGSVDPNAGAANPYNYAW